MTSNTKLSDNDVLYTQRLSRCVTVLVFAMLLLVTLAVAGIAVYSFFIHGRTAAIESGVTTKSCRVETRTCEIRGGLGFQESCVTEQLLVTKTVSTLIKCGSQ